MSAAPWMDLAWAELGQSEVKGPLANPRIRAMFADAGHPYTTSDEVPWCAAFVGAMLQRAECRPTGSLSARSYLSWGESLDTPREGAVAVFRRTSDPASGHVGFVLAATEDRITIISGNDGDRVQVRDYPRADLIGLRWPASGDGSAAAAPRSSPAAASNRAVDDAVVIDRASAGKAHAGGMAEPSREPRKWWDLLAVSRTIRGGLWQALGGTVLVLQGWVETLLAGVAEATRLEPIAAVLGKNVPALGAGLVVWGTIVVITRRIKDEGTR